MKYLVLAALAVVSTGAQAEDLSDIVTDSIGYVNVGPGLVLIEGEDDAEICQISIPAEFLDSFRAGDAEAAAKTPPTHTCIPVDAFSSQGEAEAESLLDIVVNSIGYVNVGPGLVLIEGEDDAAICQISVPIAYVESLQAGDAGQAEATPPTYTCIPVGAFVEK